MNYKIHNDESILKCYHAIKYAMITSKAYNNSNIPISINYRFKTAAENFQVIEITQKAL